MHAMHALNKLTQCISTLKN